MGTFLRDAARFGGIGESGEFVLSPASISRTSARQFGDREPITDDFLKWVESEDRELVNRLAAFDAPGFFNEVAKDQDKRRICGFSPLYSLIHLLDGAPGKHLKYSQAFTPETGSAVTFTSVIFQ